MKILVSTFVGIYFGKKNFRRNDCMLFIRKMKHSIQLELRSALEWGIQSIPHYALYRLHVNFQVAYYNKYCKDWKE